MVFTLKYTGPFVGEYWEIPTYLEVVQVKKGICKVKHLNTRDALLMQGFIEITQGVEKSVTSDEPPQNQPQPKTVLKNKKLTPQTEKEQKVIEMFKNGRASITMIAKTLKMKQVKVEQILSTYSEVVEGS